MDWILPNLAVGTHEEARDPALVEWAGLRHALILCDDRLDEARLSLPGDVLQLVIRDGRPVCQEFFAEGMAFVSERHQRGDPVMIACGQGRSRSVTFAIAYVMRQGESLEDAYRLVVSRRVNANPHPELLKSLAA